MSWLHVSEPRKMRMSTFPRTTAFGTQVPRSRELSLPPTCIFLGAYLLINCGP